MDIYLSDYRGIFPNIPDGYIDCVICDPPYGTTKNDYDQPLDWKYTWGELKRIVKPHGAIVLFAQFPFSADLFQSNRKGYRHFWIWSKRSSANFAVTKYMPLTVTEDILVFTSKGERVNYYPIMRKGKMRKRGSKNAKTNGEGFGGIKQIYYESDEYYPTNLLDFPVVPRRQSKHPSQKPVGLLEYLVMTYSKPGERVMDFCMGVGSTGLACLQQRRDFTGIERYDHYYNIARTELNLI